MKTLFRFGLPGQAARLLLLLCHLEVSDGRAAGALALPPEGILSEARLCLAKGRKTHSDPRAAVGWYLSYYMIPRGEARSGSQAHNVRWQLISPLRLPKENPETGGSNATKKAW